MFNPHVLVATPDAFVMAYVIEAPTGNRYVVYSPAVLGNPTDHRPEKWYFGTYPMTPGIVAGQAFDTAADAENGALLMDAPLGCRPAAWRERWPGTNEHCCIFNCKNFYLPIVFRSR